MNELRINSVVLFKVKSSNETVIEIYGVVCRIDKKNNRVVVRSFDGQFFTVKTEDVNVKKWLEVK